MNDEQTQPQKGDAMRFREILNRLRDVACELRNGCSPYQAADFLDATARQLEMNGIADE